MSRFRRFFWNEFFYWVLSASLVLAGIVVYGVLFDRWYKEWQNILLAGSLIYLLSVLVRSFAWINSRIRQRRLKRNEHQAT
jgi:hypothetical protein